MTIRVPKPKILGVVLAGGRSSRFGSNKAVALLGAKSLLHHVCERAAPQVERLLINCNGEISSEIDHDYDVLTDDHPGDGPLAGILAGLERAAADDCALLAMFPCDTPFFPVDLVARLYAKLERSSADFCLPYRDNDAHRTFGLWHVSCAQDLARGFGQGRLRSLQSIEQILIPAILVFPLQGQGPGGDPFFNVNTTADLARATVWLQGH